MRRPRARKAIVRKVVSLVVITVGVVALCAGMRAAGVFAAYRWAASDAEFPSATTDERIAVVGIDRESLAQVGRPWPWPRALQAQLIEGIVDAGADVVMVDLVLANEKPGDDRLAAALASADSVLSLAAEVDPGDDDLPVATSLVGPTDQLGGAAAGVGHAAMYTTPADGVIRSLPLVVEAPDRQLLPSLSLATVMAAEGATGPVTLRPDGVQVGDRVVPTTGGYEMRLNFSDGLGPDDPSSYSALDFLPGGDAPDLSDRIALVGVTEPTLGDQQSVPIAKGEGVSGVYVQAQALNTMLTSSYLAEVGAGATLVQAALLALLVAALVLWLPLRAAVPASIVVAGVDLLYAFWRFDQGEIVDLVYTLLPIVLAFSAALVARYLLEIRQRRRVTHLFATYVNDAVVDELLDEGNAEAAARGGHAEVASMFVDLRGFTTLTATSDVDDVRGVLDHFFEYITGAVFDHGGTVVKYAGDEVFAIFGAPLPMGSPAEAALSTAHQILEGAPAFRRRLEDAGLPTIGFGIGLNVGEVIAAHFGTPRRRQYDVLGDSVNVAARLCSQAMAGQAVFTESMWDEAGRPYAPVDVGGLTLKGIAEPVPCRRLDEPAGEGTTRSVTEVTDTAADTAENHPIPTS